MNRDVVQYDYVITQVQGKKVGKPSRLRNWFRGLLNRPHTD